MKVSFFIVLLTSYNCVAQQFSSASNTFHVQASTDKIVVEIHAPQRILNDKQLANSSLLDSFELRSATFDYIGIYPESRRTLAKFSDGKLKWTIYTTKPLVLNSSLLGMALIFNPGDSVRVTYNDTKSTPIISGIGSDAFKLQLELLNVQGLAGPTKHPLNLKSEEDYFAWISLLNKKMGLLLTILDSYKDKIAPFTYHYVKQVNSDWIEVDRTSAFNGLYSLYSKSATNLTFFDLNNIWDSTQSNTVLGQWLRSQIKYYASGYYLYDYNRLELRRKFNFDFTNDTLKYKALRVEKYYNYAKLKYSGHVLERLLQYILAEEVISELGPTDSLTQKLLRDYYNFSAINEYKDWMHKYLAIKTKLRAGNAAPNFVLIDNDGKAFTKENLKGKIALLDFWFTGCTGCLEMTPALREVENIFKNDSNVVFVSISIDRDKKMREKSILERKYTTGNAINVHTNGEGNDHAMIKQFNVSGYPDLILLDENGKILVNPVPDPRTANLREDLINLIKQRSTKLQVSTGDGPYISYTGNEISEHVIENKVPRKTKLLDKSKAAINVKTDQSKLSFNVRLKSDLKPENSQYLNPTKIFAVSDIEGEFEAFRTLLMNNNIIDDKFDWTFGKGHLVIVGDVFDRGSQVTECLWLIYSLEEKSKAAGGYVHFILGNHEIMNLQGDHRYTNLKYKDNARRMGQSLVQLYSENSELGRWLRTKNIVERIGNLLFVHAGIAPEVNRIPLSIDAINSLVRPYYASKKLNTSNKHLMTLFNDKSEGGRGRTSPFWFRGYYGDIDNLQQIPSVQQLDSTIKKFGIKRIVTGHTIVADTISLFYGGKVINIDTPHADGKSEALLVVENKYYRVNKSGQRILLPISDDK